MALLGEDGRGYELARKLESHGVWRTWLGDALYSSFFPFLSSPATWDTFMRPDDSNPRSHINLQLRARALLFDKASVSLFARSADAICVSKLNPHYLELNGDDLYFTLESGSQSGGDQRQQGLTSNATVSKGISKSSIVGVSRHSEFDVDSLSKRVKLEEWPETWYSKFFEKYRASKSYRMIFGDREFEKRTPEQMSAYLRVLENHKRRRVIVNDNISSSQGSTGMSDTSGMDDALFFPETMFTLNCVPDSAVLQMKGIQNNRKLPFNGVLDNLPPIMTKGPVISPIMIERLGIRPEYLRAEQGHQTYGGTGCRGSRRLLGEEQALQMSQMAVAQLLLNVGLESSSESSLAVLGQLWSSHVHKFGRILKLLADSYRKQCSAIELIKMFLQTAGHSDLGALSEIMKDNTKSAAQQLQQQVMNVQAQLQLQQKPSMQQSQQHQILRQMGAQVQQTNNPQYLTLQQQHLERMRRQQQTPRSVMNNSMNADNNRLLVQVKMENPSDFPVETNSFTGMNPRHPQLQQQRQQQLAAISSLHAQANQSSFRPMASLAAPQMQSSNTITGVPRAPPVKVEGFQELMGVDSSMKQNTDDNKLLQPQK